MSGEALRCGFVALLVRNAGKSTLLNALIVQRFLSYTQGSDHPYPRFRGHERRKHSSRLYRYSRYFSKKNGWTAMVAVAWENALDADLILMLIDAKSGMDRNARRIIDV